MARANPLVFGILRVALRGLVGGSVRRGAVAGAAGIAGASVAPRVAAAAGLTRIALRAPRAVSALRAERVAYQVRTAQPYAARNRQAAQRALRLMDLAWDGYDAVQYLRVLASPSVRDKVSGSGDGSVEQAVLGYYAILDRDERDAAMALWIAPDPGKQAWRAMNRRRSTFRLESIRTLENDGYYATTRVLVYASNNNEPLKAYLLDIFWVRTEFGWLITGQSSV